MPDLYIRHIFISENGNEGRGKYNFSFIDLNRMKHTNNKNEKIKNLGRLYHSTTDRYFDKRMRRLLIESYLGNAADWKTEKLIRRVKKYAARVSAIRNPKPY